MKYHVAVAWEWRLTFAILSFISPAAYVPYAITGNNWFRTVGATMIPLCFAFLCMFGLSSPRDTDELRIGEKVFAVLWYCWCVVLSVGMWYGQVYTDPNGSPMLGWVCLSFIFHIFPVVIYFSCKVRRIIGLMNDEVLSSYLQQSVFVSGIAACIPILYMSLETTKCMNDVTSSHRVTGNATNTTAIDYDHEW